MILTQRQKGSGNGGDFQFNYRGEGEVSPGDFSIGGLYVHNCACYTLYFKQVERQSFIGFPGET